MNSEIKPLTGLRGIAAFIVMLYHFAQPFNTLGINTHFRVRQGYLAVDLFCVLSGFILAYTYAKNFNCRFSFEKYHDFWMRRIARLYPAYLFILLIFLAKMLVDFGGDNPLHHFGILDIPGNLFMMTGWGLGIAPVIANSWSVSAEIVCYFFFPLLVTHIVFGHRILTGVATLLAMLALAAVIASGLGVKGALDVVNADSAYPLIRCFADFVLGMVAFRMRRGIAFNRLVTTNVGVGLCVAVLIGALIMHAPDLAIVACFPFLILALADNTALGEAFFGNTIAYFLGTFSYSLYLIHDMFVTTAVRLEQLLETRYHLDLYWLVAGASMILCCGTSWFIYQYVEVPGRKQFTRLSGAARLSSLSKRPLEERS